MGILTITDTIDNGKGDINDEIILLCHQCYIYDIKINEKDDILIKDQYFNLNNIKVVIFNYDEDANAFNRTPLLKDKYNTFENMMNIFKNLCQIIKKQNPNIIIYNDPFKCLRLENKAQTYNMIEHINNEIIKIPSYVIINNVVDLKKVNFFPCIIKYSIGSHTTNDTICYNYDELYECYNKNFMNKNNPIFCVEYINSYIDELKCYSVVRLMVIDNNIIDFYFRPADCWNIHTNDQNEKSIIFADNWFYYFFEKNKEYIKEYINSIFQILGNSFLAYDLILSNNKLYICEIGIKYYDNPYTKFINKFNIKLNKMSIDKNRLKNYYYNYFKKYIKNGDINYIRTYNKDYIHHAIYFTEKKQIVSHTTNNTYGNILLQKYKIGDVIKLNKGSKYIEFNIVNKTEKDGKVVLYFNNELTNDLLENRRNWVIIK